MPKNIQKSSVIILVPRLDETGPMKGAVALAHGLVDEYNVVLISLKGIVEEDEKNIKSNVQTIFLGSEKSLRKKKAILNQLIDNFIKTGPVTSISYCFSADLMNWMLRKKVRIITSVRGNLTKNYFHTYSFPGYFLAWLHYTLLYSFDQVTVMSRDMFRRLKRWGLRTHFIGNFIDEPYLKQYIGLVKPSTSERPNLLFLGGLNSRKRPDLLIESIYKLRKEGIKLNLTIAGDGPLINSLKDMINRLELNDCVFLVGHVTEPYSLLQKSDLLVLPSESEGISRSVLEALYFGVRCIVRDVDANREVIKNAVNGYLFHNDKDLVPVLQHAIHSIPKTEKRNNLIPVDFRFESNIKKIKTLLNA